MPDVESAVVANLLDQIQQVMAENAKLREPRVLLLLALLHHGVEGRVLLELRHAGRQLLVGDAELLDHGHLREGGEE